MNPYLLAYIIGFIICAPVFGYWMLEEKDIYHLSKNQFDDNFIKNTIIGVALAFFWPLGIFPLMVWILTKIIK